MKRLLAVFLLAGLCATEYFFPWRGTYTADPDGPAGPFTFSVAVDNQPPPMNLEYLLWKGDKFYMGDNNRWEHWNPGPPSLHAFTVLVWVGFDVDGSYVEGFEVWEDGEKTQSGTTQYGTHTATP